jgi:hypothetical protein
MAKFLSLTATASLRRRMSGCTRASPPRSYTHTACRRDPPLALPLGHSTTCPPPPETCRSTTRQQHDASKAGFCQFLLKFVPSLSWQMVDIVLHEGMLAELYAARRVSHSHLYRHAIHCKFRPVGGGLRLAVGVTRVNKRAIPRLLVRRCLRHRRHKVRDILIHCDDLCGVARLRRPCALAPRAGALSTRLAFAGSG